MMEEKEQEHPSIQYRTGEREFQVTPLNPSTAMVTHRDQTGWFGINQDWDVSQPYACTTFENHVSPDGIRETIMKAGTPEQALEILCLSMLRNQVKLDSRTINPEERKQAARKVLQEFLDEIARKEHRR